MTRWLPLVVLLSLVTPSLAASQDAPRRFEAARYAPAPLLPAAPVVAPVGGAASAETAADHDSDRDGRSFLTTVLHTVGGAVVGGWVGYVGSQVTLSDWEKKTNGSFSSERTAWVAGGMAVGILGSRLIGRTYSPAGPTPEPRRPGAARNVLVRSEIENSGVSNVYDLIHTMRKEWLVPRGTHSFQETASGRGMPDGTIVVNPGQAAVVVYLDNSRIGEIERMREIMVSDLMEIEFVEPQQAAYRYGSGHSHGVILLKTVR